ncbi:hypothetical protein JCM8202_004206 [Rhodotorula sphaerocarpa]
MDPFLARGSNSVPPGTYDAEPSSAPAGPAGPHASTAPSSTGGGTRAGPLFSGVPSPTTTGRTGRSTGGKSVKTPWYLTWAGIAGLVLALLVAIALGVGLGVGLGTKRSSSSGSELAAAQDGSGADPNSALSTVTQESVTASIVTTADPATVTVPISVDVTATSVETETSYRGGSTVPLPKPVEELKTYLAFLPDFAEGSKRQAIRPKHLEHAGEGFKLGWLVKGGATFADDARSAMTGSWLLVREESLEKARARLAQDIYATDGAWDMSRATITPVAVAKH